MNAFEAYLAELRDIRASGGAVPETSGYGTLATLLNDIGHHLKPKVQCFINLANTGAGIPDGGLFVANQLQKGAEPLPGQVPQRGAIEVKPPNANAREVARGEQVAKYLEKYRQVLVSSYREFVLVGYDAEGSATPLESYSLASSEAEFWALASLPRRAAAAHGERLTEFLKRAMLRQAQIVAPQELAWFLASYAREARARVEEGGELPALVTTRQALEQALGMTFEGERGEHFFRSTLVQTLFYGLFAAWVFWAEQHEPTDTQVRFRWREAGWYLHIPILSKLYGDFASPSQLGTMHLEEVLDWAGEALDRVDRASFFATFEQQHAVQYFYEPFLEAFDPELRKQLGVWYTPPEVVKYMVARVDQVLRDELDIADGLADPRVVVLDPCCGTGAYLVEVLNRIAETLHGKGGDALIANDLKHAAMSRVYGFEILPAPFVISHLQIGLALDRFGAPFTENGRERAGVYLTNALTGWEPPTEAKQHLLFPELEMERDAAANVKQKKPILVILGNPPYNGFAGLAVDEERDLVEAYRQVDKVAPPQGQGLNDLYVRFYRMAERRITEGQQGEGVVCFISNYSWLDGLSFTGMRERFLKVFDDIRIDCLNGDKYKTGKLTPEGKPDPSVFSTEKNREGIQVGTAVSTLVRRQGSRAGSRGRLPAVLGQDEARGAGRIGRRRGVLRALLSGSSGRFDVHADRGQLRLPRLAIVARRVPGLVSGGQDKPRRVRGRHRSRTSRTTHAPVFRSRCVRPGDGESGSSGHGEHSEFQTLARHGGLWVRAASTRSASCATATGQWTTGGSTGSPTPSSWTGRDPSTSRTLFATTCGSARASAIGWSPSISRRPRACSPTITSSSPTSRCFRCTFALESWGHPSFTKTPGVLWPTSRHSPRPISNMSTAASSTCSATSLACSMRPRTAPRTQAPFGKTGLARRCLRPARSSGNRPTWGLVSATFSTSNRLSTASLSETSATNCGPSDQSPGPTTIRLTRTPATSLSRPAGGTPARAA